MVRAIAKQSRTVRVPLHVVQGVQRLLSADRRLTSSLGRAPRNDELATAMGERLERIERTRQAMGAVVSYDEIQVTGAQPGMTGEDSRHALSTPAVEVELHLEQADGTPQRLGAKKRRCSASAVLDGHSHTLAAPQLIMSAADRRSRRRALGEARLLRAERAEDA
jgi:RNA polymerase primary sigma factor